MAVLTGSRDITELSPALRINNSILAQHGVKLRKGQFSLCAAAPNVGKSLFANSLAVNADAEVLYFSADSDEWTVRQRTLGIITHHRLNQIDDVLNGQNRQAIEYYGAVLDSAVGHIDWAFNDEPEFEYVVRRIKAHEAVWDRLPELTFIDNIGDMVEDENNEFSELRGLCRRLRRLARSTDSHVMGLHHVNGAKENGDELITLKDLQGKIGKVAEVVLGLHIENGRMVCHVAKNRGGPRGQQIVLPLDYSTAFIGGFSGKAA